MLKLLMLLALSAMIAITTNAQHPNAPVNQWMFKGKKKSSVDTTSLLHAFKSGQFNGHFRYLFMATDNEKGLTDFYANAIGAGIRFETARFHNFQFAISGFYIFNVGSSDLTKQDTLTGQYSRYEIGLFDVNDLANKKDINRLEELYLKYNIRHSYVRIGRQFINSTFINLQDGRISPNAVEGVWAELNEIKKMKIQFGWLFGISPRSTIKWYKPGESIGIYSVGINPDGTKSGYRNNVESSGIGLLQFDAELTKQIKLKVCNMYVENIFNTSLLQMDYNLPLKNSSSVFTSIQVVRQFAINNGGNKDQSKTYFLKGTSSFTFGGRVGWKNEQWETSLNYNRITSGGRYLIPRGWGIEPFFTFLPRERNDGFGNVNALMGKIDYNIAKARIKTSLSAGYYHLPDVKNYALNKYGMPSYKQLNADIRYTFANSFEGLEAQLLVVGKLNNGETYNINKFIFNKVNMVQYNFVLNYHF